MAIVSPVSNSPPKPVQSLPARFFDEARRVLLGESDRLHFEPGDVLRIAQDAAMRAEFADLFARSVNDPQLGRMIIGYLEDVASDLEDKSRIAEIKVELLDRAGLAVAASVTAAGIAALVATGGAFGAAILLAGGAIGLGVTGTGRTIVRLDSHNSMSDARRIRRFIKYLGD